MWTAEDDQKMRDLLGQGLTFTEAGEQMGRSKNSCIGRAHRLGLFTSRVPDIIDAKRARQPKPEPKPQRPERPQKQPEPEPVVISFPKAAKPLYPQPEASTTCFGQPKSIFGLKEHHCRFPVHMSPTKGRQLFCAAEKQKGSSYCPDHHLLVWVPPKSRARDIERMARMFK